MEKPLGIRKKGRLTETQGRNKSVTGPVSPRHNIDKLKAQVLLIHGDQDDIVNVQQSRAMYDTILAADKYAMYNEIEGAGHQLYNQTDRTDVLVLVDRFLRRCMPAK